MPPSPSSSSSPPFKNLLPDGTHSPLTPSTGPISPNLTGVGGENPHGLIIAGISPCAKLVGHTDRVTSLSFLKDDSLVSCALDGTMRIWVVTVVVISPSTHSSSSSSTSSTSNIITNTRKKQIVQPGLQPGQSLRCTYHCTRSLQLFDDDLKGMISFGAALIASSDRSGGSSSSLPRGMSRQGSSVSSINEEEGTGIE